MLEHVAEIRGVVITAAGGDVIDLEVVALEEMLGAVDADKREIFAERHLPVRLEQAGQVIGRDAKLFGHGIAGDFILVMALEEDANVFEQFQGAAAGGGDRLAQEVLDAPDQSADEFFKRFGGGAGGLQFAEGV